MGEKMKKNSSLTIRIECKTKEELKKIAKKKGLTMSELANECLTELVEQEIFKKQHQEHLEDRIKNTDDKLSKLKNKMNW
ncbi:hypothetical protein [Clostridium thermobutyricum]|uniref:Ribbon-helix-helix protein, copG family n=1 Tax=Clostridium thermobutyricum DSM 4928 TaxID=1121339 RepID=A0A1V4STA6_9CLOT|nr:hypothetical protein [Clostridium thermobutyricum]OPX46477.1 hypothetical protein CLTHE_28640 [Clostridium thermobutyricum DSM 4928]